MAGLTLGVVWLISKPDWMLRDPSQIVIEGNKSLSPDMIRAMLAIQYPKSVLALQPEALARQLKTEAPIAEASVTRRMFPPGVVIQIQERIPVATVYAGSNSSANTPINKALDNLFVVALLDEQGTWMPYEKFASLNQSQSLPSLKVIGMSQEYRSQWQQVYQAIRHSPVKVTMLDWREPSNLILQTDLGLVHCGPLSDRFEDQLQVLDRMRKLPETIKAEEIAYIDVSNPEMPMLELTSGAVKSMQTDRDED
jgi:cell division protein FtsQ